MGCLTYDSDSLAEKMWNMDEQDGQEESECASMPRLLAQGYPVHHVHPCSIAGLCDLFLSRSINANGKRA
jgi:hypothetical protein